MEGCSNEIVTYDWKAFFPLLSPVVVIILFGIERFLSYGIRKKEIERNWYYKVLIDPSLLTINKFFSDADDLFRKSFTTLGASKELPHSEFMSLKSREIGSFQIVKRKFDFDIVTPIYYQYPVTGGKLQAILLDLEDAFATNIDQELFTEDDMDRFSSRVSDFKANWFATLYEPLGGRKKKRS